MGLAQHKSATYCKSLLDPGGRARNLVSTQWCSWHSGEGSGAERWVWPVTVPGQTEIDEMDEVTECDSGYEASGKQLDRARVETLQVWPSLKKQQD